MRDVEQARFGARMQMLGDNAGRVLHRHFIAGEADHAGAALAVQVMERRLPSRSGAATLASRKQLCGRSSRG